MPDFSDASEFDFPREDWGVDSECLHLAPLLTALFDGEANSEEARSARAHLKTCNRCTHVWRSWTRTRSLMQSVPAPPVPLGLLTRILLACRLTALARKTTRSTAMDAWMQMPGVQAHDARILRDTLLDSQPSSLPLGVDGFFSTRIAPAPPPHLKDEILRRTVGAQAARQDSVQHGDSIAPPSINSSRLPRHLRRLSTAAAVPAMAAWLLLLTHQLSQYPAAEPALELTEQTTSFASSIERPAAARRPSVAARPLVGRAKKTTVAPSMARLSAKRDSESTRAVIHGRAQAEPKGRVNAKPNSSHLPGRIPHKARAMAATPVSDAHRTVRPPAARKEPTIKPRRIATTVQLMPAVARKLAMMWQSPADRHLERKVEWSSSHAWPLTASQEPSSEQEPSFEAATAAMDDEETLEQVRSISDSRPDDVRDVLDDYRASLLAEGTEAALGDEES
ncbi:MAG: zf-HC2 domain-containing protein [Armatimonadota bacterium]|nr:zf-HC2 domain-containing protein [Armatimonadota bacterium]